MIGDLQELCGSHPGGGHQEQDQNTTAHLLQGKRAAIHLIFQDFHTIHTELYYFIFLLIHFRFIVIKHKEGIWKEKEVQFTASQDFFR